MPEERRSSEMERNKKIGLTIILVTVIALFVAAWQLYELMQPA